MFHIPEPSPLEHASSCLSNVPRTAWYTLLIFFCAKRESSRMLEFSSILLCARSLRESVGHFTFFGNARNFWREATWESRNCQKIEASHGIRKKIEAHMKHFELMNSKRRSEIKWRNDGFVNRFGQSHQNREKIESKDMKRQARTPRRKQVSTCKGLHHGSTWKITSRARWSQHSAN